MNAKHVCNRTEGLNTSNVVVQLFEPTVLRPLFGIYLSVRKKRAAEGFPRALPLSTHYNDGRRRISEILSAAENTNQISK